MKKLIVLFFIAASLITYSAEPPEKQSFVSYLSSLKQRVINYFWGVKSTPPIVTTTTKQLDASPAPITKNNSIIKIAKHRNKNIISDEELEELEKFEDVTALMEKFSKEPYQKQIDDIIDLLLADQKEDRNDLIRAFNAYNPTTKQKFIKLFFQGKNFNFGIKLQNFAAIVQSKLINTNNDNAYLFFIDENGKMCVYDMTNGKIE